MSRHRADHHLRHAPVVAVSRRPGRAVKVAVRVLAHGAAMSCDLTVLSHRLDREWRLVRHRPDLLARADGWRVVPRPLTDLDDLLAACGFRVEHTTERNEVLARLAALAHHDDLAARIVLQRLVPGLIGIARARRVFEHDAFEELIGAAWLTIRHCRPEGKRQLAANLVRDAAYRAFTAPGRRLSATEIAVDPRTLDEEPAVDRTGPCEELAMLLADARACGVPTEDLDLFRELATTGSPGRLAALRRVTPRTIRNHRDRAVANLRRVAVDAA